MTFGIQMQSMIFFIVVRSWGPFTKCQQMNVLVNLEYILYELLSLTQNMKKYHVFFQISGHEFISDQNMYKKGKMTTSLILYWPKCKIITCLAIGRGACVAIQ